jgi:hypothetical protein
MAGGGMLGRWCEAKRGMRTVKGNRVHDPKGSEELYTGGIRVLVVATKSRNGDGAKGDREEKA